MSRKDWNRARAALLLAAGLLLLVRLGATGLWAPDEPRYGEIAEETRALHHGWRDLVLLRLNGEPYTQKPPLYYWLAALSGAPWGRVSEAAARLPSALAGIALVALTLGLGAELLGRRRALLGGALLLTCFQFARMARRVQLDVVLALFETLALSFFWRIERGRGTFRRNRLALHACLGLAVLTKGPVGFLVPLLVTAGYLAWGGRTRELRRLFLVPELAFSIGPGLAWIAAAVALAPPGFFHEAIGKNLFGRFFAGTAHPRPLYYYLYQFPVDLLPWSLALPLVPRSVRAGLAPEAEAARRDGLRFLLAWVIVPLVFFSLSTGKRGLYLLPSFPAAALLFSHALLGWLEGGLPAERRLAVGLSVLAALFTAGAVAVAWLDPLRARGASLVTGALGAAIVAAAAVLWRLLAGRLPAATRRLAVPIAAAYAIELVVFTVAFPALDPEKSPRPVAEAAAALTRPGEPIGLVGDRALTGGLVYYGHRPVRELHDRSSIARFVAQGGKVLVVRKHKRKRVEAVVATRVVFEARHGRRALLVLAPKARARPAGAAGPSGVSAREPLR